jgi:hypothetical protein
MPWADGDDLTPTNLNNTRPSWTSLGSPGLGVLYVKSSGSDSLDGLTWETAKATIENAVSSLSTALTGGQAHKVGTIYIGAGVFEPASTITFASEIVFEGIGARQIDGARNGTVIKMPDNFDADLFASDADYTDWAHFVVFRNLSMEGNKENQAGFGVTRFLDDSNATTLAFSAANRTITRGSDSWIDDGYAAGQKIRVHGTVSNNSVYTIAAGGVSASVLTVEEALTDESALNGAGVHASPYNLVSMKQPGFLTFFDNVFFRNAPGYGIDISNAITNLNIRNCGAVKCHQGFVHTTYPDTGNLCHFTMSDTNQIDDCGPAPLYFEDRGDGGVNIIHIENLECEAATTADVHDAIIRYHKIDGNNPMHFNIGTVNAFRSGGLGDGTAVVHELTGGAGRWNIYAGVFEDGYTEEFRSDHRNFGTGANIGQQTGQPIKFGLHGGPRSSEWFNKVQLWSGGGDPEGIISAPVGSLYMRDDGSAGSQFYVKESGSTDSTGWAAK